MKEVCAKWSIPVFDNYHGKGINWSNAAQKAEYESANLHFNAKGYLRISEVYESILKNNLVIGSTTINSTTINNNYNNGTENDDNSISMKFEHASSAGGSNNRAVAVVELKQGQIIDFTDSNSWNTYKYAIASGSNGVGSSWYGGGYQTGSFTLTSDGTHTIMIARQDNATITAQELESFSSIMKIE